MFKIKPKQHRGTEYVRLANLPDEQAGNLLDWLPQTCLTKMEAGEDMLDDCIDYEDYEFWFEHCYRSGLQAFEEEI